MKQQQRLTKGTSARIVELLRSGPLTIDEIAAEIELTRTAVRAQLATLLRDGIVEERGARRGPSKPSRVYGVTEAAELQLSRAYAPVLAELLRALNKRLSQEEFDSLMREVGRGLASGVPTRGRTLRDRVGAAQLLLSELGGSTEVIEDDTAFTILGYGCPLSAATTDHAEACHLMESFLGEVVGAPLTACCARYERKRCCFEVAQPAAGA